VLLFGAYLLLRGEKSGLLFGTFTKDRAGNVFLDNWKKVDAGTFFTTRSGRSCPTRRPGRAADAPRAAGEAANFRQCFVVTHGMRHGCSRRR